MSAQIRRQRRELISLSVFLLVAGLLTAYLVIVTGNIRGGDNTTYNAVFTDVSGLTAGDQVRIASVPVGRVTSVEVADDTKVHVQFEVDERHRLTTNTTATVRYRNLIGDRYLELEQPGPGAAQMREGDTIEPENTQSALDLDTLLEGFRPLFRGLNAPQINLLAQQLTAVLNGQTSAVNSLLTTVASLAPRLADREALITSTLDNLNAVLGTLDARRHMFGSFLQQLQRLMDGLAEDDARILDAARTVTGLAEETATLAADLRGDLDPAVLDLGTTLAQIEAHGDTLESVIRAMPDHYRAVVSAAKYGNFFNFFLCGMRLHLTTRDGQDAQTPWLKSDARRCQP